MVLPASKGPEVEGCQNIARKALHLMMLTHDRRQLTPRLTHGLLLVFPTSPKPCYPNAQAQISEQQNVVARAATCKEIRWRNSPRKQRATCSPAPLLVSAPFIGR
jgi:hypothetical protein